MSSFNPILEGKCIEFVNHLKNINIQFINTDYKQVSFDLLTKEDFVYVDPPYLITVANYNENGGWNELYERDLLELLDKIHKQGVRFALSNVLEHKGKSNNILKDNGTYLIKTQFLEKKFVDKWQHKFDKKGP